MDGTVLGGVILILIMQADGTVRGIMAGTALGIIPVGTVHGIIPAGIARGFMAVGMADTIPDIMAAGTAEAGTAEGGIMAVIETIIATDGEAILQGLAIPVQVIMLREEIL